jgi:molecular chaperone DnaK (HSP70)
MFVDSNPESQDYEFAGNSVGAIHAEADDRTLKTNEITIVLTEITTDHIKMKQKCSLAVSDLKPADLQKAATALQFLSSAEKPATIDIDQARNQLLKHIRQARTPELIERLHGALKNAVIIR